MKSFGIMRISSLLMILFYAYLGNAQDYIVTTTGDTLSGDVRPLLYGIDKKVQFRGDDKKKTLYPMFKVLSFSYKDEIYQPVKGPDGYTFMKLLQPGYLSLYSYQMPNQSTFDGLFLTKKDGSGMEVPNLGFKKFMKQFLEDCPDVVESIDNGELAKKELKQIIDEYNQCLDERSIDHGKIVAEKREQKKQLGPWDLLEEKVRAQSAFEGKKDALDMIKEIKNKISNSDKIPNFLLEGLKNSLDQDIFKTELDNALKEIN
jgi:hypothetical protein